MQKLFILFLIVPTLVFSQRKGQKDKKTDKVDGYSGATYYTQVKGTISAVAKP